jgi:hypothetical protein
MLELLDELSKSGSMGLHDGKMGVALCYYKQYRITRDKVYLNKGRILLNYIAANIGEIKRYSFSDGLLGIGWGVEWLAQNKYLKADTNEVLCDMDDEIYRLVMYSKADKLSLASGTLAYLLYFYKRITHKNKSRGYHREAVLTECLILCIDDLFGSIVNDEGTDLKKNTFDAQFLSQVFILVNKILPLRIDHQVGVIRDLVATKILCDLLESSPELNNKEKCFYANALLQAGRHSKNKIWIEMSQQVFRTTAMKRISLSKNSIYKSLDYLSKSTNDYSWQEGWLLG